ncbi:MAG: Mov34/MPN/PAD-1 family protein [Chloroflexota bacterium]
MNEISYIITGQQRGRIWYGRLQQRQIGEPTQVEFDWSWALTREENRGDVLGFYHTHPTGHNSLSQRDIATMQAWVSSLGKPLLCAIKGDQLAAYLFQTDEDTGRLLPEIQRFPRNIIICTE